MSPRRVGIALRALVAGLAVLACCGLRMSVAQPSHNSIHAADVGASRALVTTGHSPGRVDLNVDSRWYRSKRPPALVTFTGMVPGDRRSAVLGVRSRIPAAGSVRIKFVDAHEHNHCTAHQLAAGCDPNGPGELGSDLVFDISSSSNPKGPFSPVWHGHGSQLEATSGVEVAPSLAGHGGVVWLEVAASLPHATGNGAQGDSYTFTISVTLTELTNPAPHCKHTIGRHNGSMTLTSGVWCLPAGSYVNGSLAVSGSASLIGTGGEVYGSLSFSGRGAVDLSATTKVGGSLAIANTTGSVSVTDSVIGGAVDVSNNHTDTSPVIGANRIGGALSCAGNRPAPAGASNSVAGRKSGQCVGF